MYGSEVYNFNFNNMVYDNNISINGDSRIFKRNIREDEKQRGKMKVMENKIVEIECIYCECWDVDTGECALSSIDKIFVCPIEGDNQ